MPEPIAYLNGRLTPASQAHLAVYDLGVVMGATVTEMMRTFRGELFRLPDHLTRLEHSLRYVRFDIGLSMDEFRRTVEEVASHNGKLLDTGDELAVVIFVTAGESPAYAGSAAGNVRTTPTVCVHTFPLPFELWADKVQTGVHLVTPSIRQIPPQCIDPKVKYRSRMHYYLADQEARLTDPDAAALLLDLEGNIAETTAANFLIVENGTIVSPSQRNTLSGVSRATVIELASELAIPFAVRDLQTFDAINADEAFLASTPYCLMPVTKINAIPVGQGTPGPIYGRLMQAWSARVGFDISAQIVESARRRKKT